MELRERTNILVASDDPHVRDACVECLPRPRFAVTGCSSGGHVLQRALDTLPDLIVLDIAPSDVDGLSVAAAIKEDIRTRHIPIIGMAAHWTPAVCQEAQRAGISVMLLTPCSPAHLLGEVERTVRQTLLLSAALGHVTVGADPAMPMGLRNAVRRRYAS